jgi:hypothetical protein
MENNFLRHTVTLRPVFEVISEIGAYNFGEQVELRRFAWQAPEAQGSDLSGNLFGLHTRSGDLQSAAETGFTFLTGRSA